MLKNVEFISFIIDKVSVGYIVGETSNFNNLQIQNHESFEWLLKNSKKMNSDAIFQLASCFEFGAFFNFPKKLNNVISIQKNIETAIELYKIGAEIGSSHALHHLGEMYYHGVSIKKDLVQAKHYFMKSAEMRNRDSLYILGVLEYNEEKISEAFTYFQKAADLGHTNACVNVALALHKGDLVWKKNNAQAFFYIKMAQENEPNDFEIKQILDNIYNELLSN